MDSINGRIPCMFDNSLHPRCAMSIPDLDPMISTIAWEDFMAERYVCVVESLFRLKREILENDGKLTFILAESLRAIGRLADANSVIGDDPTRFVDSPFEFDIWVCAAEIAKEAGRLEDANRHYDSAIELIDVVPGWIQVLKGTNLIRLQQFHKAIDAFRAADQLEDVDHDEVALNLAYAYRAIGKYDVAMENARKAESLGGDSFTNKVADLLRSLSRRDQGEKGQ